MTSIPLKVRRAIVVDAPHLAQLSRGLGYPSAERAIVARLSQIAVRDDHAIFVVENSAGLILGWIHSFVAFRVTSDAFIEIGGLVVDEAARNGGVGRQLVEAVKAWAREQGIGRLRVRVNETREGAHNFYHRLDFATTKHQRILEYDLDANA